MFMSLAVPVIVIQQLYCHHHGIDASARHSCACIGLWTRIVRTHLCQNSPGEIWITKPYEQYKQRSETPGERPKLLVRGARSQPIR